MSGVQGIIVCGEASESEEEEEFCAATARGHKGNINFYSNHPFSWYKNDETHF